MLNDSMLYFADSQSVASGATVLSGVVDTKTAGDAVGEELYVHVIAVGGSTASGAAVSASLRTGDTVSGSVISGATVLQTVNQVKNATVVPGMELAKFRMPEGAQRYLDLSITVDGTVSDLAVAAFINADR